MSRVRVLPLGRREPEPAASVAPRHPWRTSGRAIAGPAIVVLAVAFATHGFLLHNVLTNQHPDILAQWLPHYCFLGRSLAHGHVPLWNPFQLAGTPYASDPQSGWLNASAMALFTTLHCGTALRLLIVLNPLLAGLGLFWFLRKEELSRVAATCGGLSYSMIIASSAVAVSLPFAGTLAWTPFVLVGASGFLRSRGVALRIAWLALAAFAWGQVAASHMSHGLAMATVTLLAYIVARSVHDVRGGEATRGGAAGVSLALLATLPLANLAIFIPRIALLPQTNLRTGYASVGGAVARLAGIAQQPLAPRGVWSGWPLAIGSTPGAYAGVVILLGLPLALRAWGRRYLVVAFAVVGVISYVLTLDALVSAGWFRNLILNLPYGDVYLHNPGRLRYLMLLVVPVLGAVGIQGLLERPLALRPLIRWSVPTVLLFLVIPLVLGAYFRRFAILLVALPFAVAGLAALATRWRWKAVLVVAVLTAELLAGAITSQTYRGGTVLLGLENTLTVLTPGPLRWPDVSLDRYFDPGPIGRRLEREPGRFLTWVPPAVFYNKGYLFTQDPLDWMALENGRGMLFGLRDSMGYSPVQLTRYWSFVRATNDGAPLFYNAAVLEHPSLTDARLLGIRWLIVPSDVRPPIHARKVLRPGPFHGGRYSLYEVRGSEPLVSVVPDFRVTTGADALRKALRSDFDPATRSVVQVDPGIRPSEAASGTARVRHVAPEDLRISVTATAPSLVVVRNSFDSGWEATVDGRTVPVLAADYFLQAVAVPRGHHEIELAYRDPKIGEGLAVSTAVWIALAVGALAASVASRVVRRRRGAAGTPR